MDRVVFDIDDTLAKKYRYASADKKKEITGVVSRMLSKSLEKSDDDFWDFMERAGKQATENGLTEDELNKMLNED
ncbi:hypothetical protein A0256_07040 [Mucilaginibacter sp. PAMC 26640]|nr:hypothetical protein A0256_07040 [Mucilaginibacter sp. PAMC 26640]